MMVPQPTNKSDESTLPDPEFNPLLNPLLAAHMGRWAEVYFTHPPEKRGEAIAELLRELESNASPDPPVQSGSDQHTDDTYQRIDDGKWDDQTRAPDGWSSSPQAELVLPCNLCGQNNSATQRFCGSCGASLCIPSEAQASRTAETVAITESSWSETAAAPENSPEPYGVEHGVYSTTATEIPEAPHDSRSSIAEENLPSFAIAPEHDSNRYRIYIGMVFAILFAALIYLAWRGTHAISHSAAPLPSAPEAMPSAQSGPPIPDQPGTAGTAALPATGPPASAAQIPGPANPAAQQEPVRPARRGVPVTASSASAAVGQSGSEELVLARKYLKGNSGAVGDSQEAAVWLWKAVAKQNLAATMLLSDLYLRGDGVPKSCDQARLLLDAAARKGATGAAERLRNLQAFGCQ